MASAKLAKVEDALRHFKEGGIVLVMDSEDREDECDLIMSAEVCTPEKMAFMIKHSTGIVCVAADKERLEGFGLHPATGLNTDKNATNFYVSTDFLPTTTTGVSAYDRCETVKAFCDPTNPPESFSKPGHMFPLCARKGGVLERPGHTESTYDLCRLAGCKEYVGILAEMMHEDGTMYRKADSLAFSKEHNLPMVTVEQLIDYRKMLSEKAELEPEIPMDVCLLLDDIPQGVDPLDNRISLAAESIVEPLFVADKCTLKIFNVPASKGNPRIEVAALVKGEVRGRSSVPCRVHSECFTGDTLGSKRCDCGAQLEQYCRTADREPAFVLLYVRGHEGRGIGLANKIRAYKLQEKGVDTVDANLQLGFPVDSRDYSPMLEILQSHLGVKSVALYTNNPDKMDVLRPVVAEVRPLAPPPLEQNMKYLETKRDKTGHKTVLNTFKLPLVRLASKTKVGVVYATWNDYYVKSLLDGVKSSLRDAKSDVTVIEMPVPGAADLVSGVRAMLRKHKPDAVICIGVLIKGSTDQHEMVGNATCHGLTSLNAMQDTPIVSGLLICKDETQAHDRSFGSGNHGAAWARTALTMVACNEEEEKRTP